MSDIGSLLDPENSDTLTKTKEHLDQILLYRLNPQLVGLQSRHEEDKQRSFRESKDAFDLVLMYRYNPKFVKFHNQVIEYKVKTFSKDIDYYLKVVDSFVKGEKDMETHLLVDSPWRNNSEYLETIKRFINYRAKAQFV